mgnify:CR=1 FL=1
MLSFYALAIFWQNGNKMIQKGNLREDNKGNIKNRKNRNLYFCILIKYKYVYNILL